MSFILGIVVGLSLAYAGAIHLMKTGKIFKLGGYDVHINVL